jgi:hypothetical protein
MKMIKRLNQLIFSWKEETGIIHMHSIYSVKLVKSGNEFRK